MATRHGESNLSLVLAMVGVGVASAAESPGLTPRGTEISELEKLVGQPVDIAPWAYVWRADLAVQEKPEAYFIPRRLGRMDNVYRTASHTLPEQELTSVQIPKFCAGQAPGLAGHRS